jgi:hypothetical protein
MGGLEAGMSVFSLKNLLAGMADKNRNPDIKTGHPVGSKFGSAEWDKAMQLHPRLRGSKIAARLWQRSTAGRTARQQPARNSDEIAKLLGRTATPSCSGLDFPPHRRGKLGVAAA